MKIRKRNGAVEDYRREKIERVIRLAFESAGINVVMSRETDDALIEGSGKKWKRKEMEARRELIKKTRPNMVISLHQNSYTNHSLRGAQVFYKTTDERGKLLAQCVQDSFNQMKEAVRECNILSGDYYIN